MTTMNKTTLGFTFGVAALLITACSAPGPSGGSSGGSSSGGSSSGSSGGSSSGGSSSGSSGVTTDEDETAPACVTKTDKGNALGVGAYCDKATRCKTGQFCSGDFGAPEGASFCTIICATD